MNLWNTDLLKETLESQIAQQKEKIYQPYIEEGSNYVHEK